MSQIEFENPMDSVESNVIDALGAFDTQRGELYDTLAEIALEAPDAMEYQVGVGEKVSAVALAMQDLAYELLKADGIESSKEQLVTLWQTDDNERVAMFRSLIACEDECFEAMEADKTEELVDELYGEATDENSLSEEIFEKYRAFLAGDIYEFAAHVQKKHELKKADMKEIEVKTILLDVQKVRTAARGMAAVAIGVAAGAAISQLMRRRS